VDAFFAAWKGAGFTPVGHIVFHKTYASAQRFLRYSHESAYVLAKGRPQMPADPLSDVLPWRYSGNHSHPTEKAVPTLQPIIEAFTKTRTWSLIRLPDRAARWSPLLCFDGAISASNSNRSTAIWPAGGWPEWRAATPLQAEQARLGGPSAQARQIRRRFRYRVIRYSTVTAKAANKRKILPSESFQAGGRIRRTRSSPLQR
jgi:hypothetical protein